MVVCIISLSTQPQGFQVGVDFGAFGYDQKLSQPRSARAVRDLKKLAHS